MIEGWCADEGFPLARVAPAEFVASVRETAQARRRDGHLADMGWMTEEWIDRATDPERFLDGAKSRGVVALPCHAPDPDIKQDRGSRGRVARYARGRDYHRIFEKKLRRIARKIRDELGAGARATVDYGPLLERPWAALAGLGWLGKSTMLLVPGIGPWVMLGVIATTLELEPDVPVAKTCGSCTRCIVACPTGAIAPDGHIVDARRCISYHTIENRGPIPRELRPHFRDWVFGCDECLDACPVGAGRWDAHAEMMPPSADRAFPPLSELLALDEEAFRERFAGTAVMRAKRDGMARNACIALGNVGTGGDVTVLVAALDDGSALVRGHAAWALGRLAERGVLAPRSAIEPLRDRLVREDDPRVREEIDAAIAAVSATRA
jgi:epoxyqueuosine reductase